jgi:hypothetical protein
MNLKDIEIRLNQENPNYRRLQNIFLLSSQPTKTVSSIRIFLVFLGVSSKIEICAW